MVTASVFYFIEGYFLLGAIGTFLAGKNKPLSTRRERWLKLLVHFIIVNALASIILYATKAFGWVMIPVLITGAWELIHTGRDMRRKKYFYILTALVYVAIAIGFYLMATSLASFQLIFVFLIVFTFDGFSQIAGQLFGRHKLFPDTSPNKTFEGLSGGIVMALVTAWFMGNWIGISVRSTIIFASIIILAALFGDWLASYYKRLQGIKDYSDLIPGHGGVLDRFDSWFFAGAVVWVISFFFRLIFLF